MRGSGDRICCTFSTYNVLGLIFGALVVGVSAWLAVDKASFFDRLQIHNLTEEQHEEFRNISVVDYGAYILVGVGAAIVLQSLIGTIGTLMGCCGNKQARCCLITYGVMVLAVIVVEIVAAVLILHVYHGDVEKEVEAFMNSTIERDYKPDNPTAVTVLWDHMMTQLECCGVQGYTDFTSQVPSSCCSSSNFTCPDLEAEATLPQVIIMMFVHICRKIIYGLDISYRICIYILGTLMISVVSDYKTSAASRSYFADSENIFNQWFVKLGWFWTCSVLGSFIYLTSSTFSCGRPDVVRKSFFRLGIATFVWFSLTSFFELIEYKTGLCDMTKYRRKETCLGHGHNWKGFDISGHAFILIFCNLVIIEEGKAYLGWEKIKDFLRNEEHGRVNPDNEKKETPLGKLKYDEFIHLRTFYPKNTPYVRAVFCLLAAIISLWDFMLLCTVLYFHMMIEKVVASGLAVLSWFALYKFFYRQDFSPGLPGSGPFKYVTWQDPYLMTKEQRTKALRRHREAESSSSKWSSKDEVPKFMGMPLYALKDYKEEEVKTDLTEEEVFRANSLASGRGSMSSMGSLSSMPQGRKGSIAELSGVPGRSRARSRSQSRSRVGGSRDGASKTRLNSHHVNPVGWS